MYLFNQDQIFKQIQVDQLCGLALTKLPCLILLMFAFVIQTSTVRAVEVGRVPDAGTILRGTEQLQNFDAPIPSQQIVPKAPPRPTAGQTQFKVSKFRITGATLIPSSEIQQILEPWLNREITFSDLEDALQAISDLYQKQGWYARPQLPQQDLVDGTVTIEIIEGRLGAIQVEEAPETRFSKERVAKTLGAHQRPGYPLDLKAMERSISILNDTPGIGVSAALAPGEAAGTSDIVVKVDPKKEFGGSASVDNFGAKSTGYGRLSLNSNLDNPLGFGDQGTFNFVGSQGTLFGRLAYMAPVGYDGLRVGANYSAMTYGTVNVTPKQTGNAQIGEVNAIYPILRSSAANINSALAFDSKRYYNAQPTTNTGAITTTGDKRIRSTMLSLSGDMFDSIFSGGVNLWGANLTNGNLYLNGNSFLQAVDQNTLQTDGNYTKFAANYARLQQLSEKNSLWFSFQGQLASKNLDSSEDFSLGGPQGVRAYPVYEAQGDQGWLGTIEGRHNLTQEWQATVFYDMGRIMVNRYPGFLAQRLTPNLYNLQGAGLGLNYTLTAKMTARFMIAQQIGGNPGANFNGNNNDGTSARTRGWISVTGYM